MVKKEEEGGGGGTPAREKAKFALFFSSRPSFYSLLFPSSQTAHLSNLFFHFFLTFHTR